MTIVHFVRHGQSIWHEGNRYTGSSDVPLSAEGEEQAARLALWAVARPISRVVSSDLMRAVSTATPSAEGLGLTLVIDTELREADFGQAEGLTPGQIQDRFPEAWQAFTETPATTPLPGGELGEHVVARVLDAVVRQTAATESGELLLVGHGTAWRQLFCVFLGLPIDDYHRVFPALDNAAVSTFDLALTDIVDGHPKASLVALNRAPVPGL